MSLITIKLPQGQWKYDPNDSLGPPGGFGAVFSGEGEGHSNLAIKKLHLDAQGAAHREMRIAEDLSGRELSNLVPIYDAGLDADSDSYFVVMARADKSLQDHIDAKEVQNQNEVIAILMNIAKGLQEVPDLVHRDIKPANILLHEGIWKIADFGIARFVEESTSLQTLKGYLSPQYAAPEQWLFERATNLTDIYALGCISHAILVGSPPFDGPMVDLREAHLTKKPGELPENIHSKLVSLISMMLRKSPSARPNAERVLGILENFLEDLQKSSGSDAYEMLAKVGSSVALAQADEESRALLEKSKKELRENAALAGRDILQELVGELFSNIERAAPNAKHRQIKGKEAKSFKSIILGMSLGEGEISVVIDTKTLPLGLFKRSGWNVLVGATIHAIQRNPPYSPSSSLWYMDPTGGEVFRWYEVSYWSLAGAQRGAQLDEPHALTKIEDADFAAAPVMHTFSFAFEPRLIDDEDKEDFFERWVSVFARAVKGNLNRPSRFPLSGNL